MKVKKILFICKHNIFRSKVAEGYFNQINKTVKTDSAGLIIGKGLIPKEKEIIKTQQLVAKKFGIELKTNPQSCTVGLLRKQDLIIIVANDIPLEVFNNKDYVKKAIVWKIPDVHENNAKTIEKIIKAIIQKVNKFNNTIK
jgi:protein-tyrosine-phosphatase